MDWIQYPACLSLEKTTFPSQSPAGQEGTNGRRETDAFANRHVSASLQILNPRPHQ